MYNDTACNIDIAIIFTTFSETVHRKTKSNINICFVFYIVFFNYSQSCILFASYTQYFSSHSGLFLRPLQYIFPIDRRNNLFIDVSTVYISMLNVCYTK